VLHHLAQIYLLTDVIRYVETSARLTIVALKSGDQAAIATGLGKLSYNNAVASLRLPADWFIRLAARYSTTCEDEQARTNLDLFRTYDLYLQGRLADAENLGRSVLERMKREGEVWHRMGLVHHLRHLQAVRGHSDKELEEAEVERRTAEEIAEPDSISWAHYGFANALSRMGRLDEAHQHLSQALAAIEGLHRPLTRSIALVHAGFVYLQSSDYEQAITVLDESRRVLQSELMYFEYQVGAYPRLIEALLGPDWHNPLPRAVLRRAKRFSLMSRLFGWRFPTLRPHALRIRGRLLWASGRGRKAVKAFEKAISAARGLGADYDLARSLLDLSAIDANRRDELRAEGIAMLKRLKAVIPFAERWQLGENPDRECHAEKYPSA
jgi:tetratricopeptide (TPR) repeat protein